MPTLLQARAGEDGGQSGAAQGGDAGDGRGGTGGRGRDGGVAQKPLQQGMGVGRGEGVYRRVSRAEAKGILSQRPFGAAKLRFVPKPGKRWRGVKLAEREIVYMPVHGVYVCVCVCLLVAIALC